MIFVIGYSDGHEILSSESVPSADAALEAERKCQETTDGNLGVVLVNPSLDFRGGRWIARYGGIEKTLHVDYGRSPSWSSDGINWESVYHAIERFFDEPGSQARPITATPAPLDK